ncbi:hypothetical protein [Sphingomonas sp. BK481]|uniref:hypothetical protein n=1 Tax=Sphingomonas sp. BK481 TaxID=2586981 RepID=UPI00161A0710|nr:hypothetical protein [Sphingomonas sp. BK481]MBB3588939.1 hypothetical protein [Sphingomonas sp. BK481]
MARPEKKNQKEIVRELVQQQRDALYASGHQNMAMSVRPEVIDQIDVLKKRYKLRSRDAVIARVIAKSKATFSPETFALQAADKNTLRKISPIVPNDLVDYVKQIQRRFRGIACGPVFEMIFAEVGNDLSNPAVQLELIQRERAVSG